MASVSENSPTDLQGRPLQVGDTIAFAAYDRYEGAANLEIGVIASFGVGTIVVDNNDGDMGRTIERGYPTGDHQVAKIG